jgi:hypothetical protein
MARPQRAAARPGPVGAADPSAGGRRRARASLFFTFFFQICIYVRDSSVNDSLMIVIDFVIAI